MITGRAQSAGLTSPSVTHLLHGELLEHGVVLVEPQPTQPVQDAVLLGGAGLRLAGRRRRRREVSLGTGLSVRQDLVVGGGGGQVQGEGLRLAAALREEVVLQAGLRGRRVEQRRAVLLLLLLLMLGCRLRPHSERTLSRQGRHRGRDGRRERGRKRGEVRGGPREDTAVGADDRLNTGHPVYCPEERGGAVSK